MHDEIQATFVSVLVKLSIIGFEVSVVTFFMRIKSTEIIFQSAGFVKKNLI